MSNHKISLPTIFSNLSTIQESLTEHWHINSYSLSPGWDCTSEKFKLPVILGGAWQSQSGSILARWSSAYDVYLDIRGDGLTGQKRKGTATLRILRELGSAAITLSQTVVDNETDWDLFCPMFERIINLMEDIVELDLTLTAIKPKHCVDMAIVGPLFEVR